MRIPVIFILALGLLSAPALATPKITERVQHYLVSATTIQGLRTELRNKGPRKFWGSAYWLVKWSGSCQVEVTVTYTLPKHRNPASMPRNVRAKFDRMLINLAAHERLHGQNGIRAGTEIERNGCRNAKKILKKYNRADRALDRRTRHGRKDGVVLN